mmetsp:Transcript_17333/g.22554  ORF Transcript_17333/g.22554 Transcript_17333/m.22554 type:complete len:112 (+) Transcript_17333:156-491(+)
MTLHMIPPHEICVCRNNVKQNANYMRYYSCQKMVPKPSTHTWYKNCYWFLPFFLAVHNANALITLKTKTQIPNLSTKEVYNYLATSKHWPDIVWSSFSVEGDRTEVQEVIR